MALPQKYRLTDKKDVGRVIKRGKILNSELFQIRFLANNLDFDRFVVITGLRFSKKATIRNKTKRQLNEIIRINILKVKSGLDIVLLARLKILDKKSEYIKEELINRLLKIG